MKNIAVVGSFGRDLIMQVSHIPARGETVGEGRFSQVFGGKGANQALAARRAGGEVSFIGCVGKDEAGDQGIENFTQEGMNTAFMSQTDAIGTGTAMIFVGDDGENSITVAPEANYHLTRDHIDAAEDVLRQAGLILMQLEIPMDTIEYVVDKAWDWKIPVMFNPAPARPLSDTLLQKLHTLVVNETEAEIISGEKLEGAESISRIAHNLRAKGPEVVIITLGAEGAFIAGADIAEKVAGNSVKAVDTTAAGDVFCGSLACALAHDNLSLVKAVEFANAAAAIAVTRVGAQPSVPVRSEIDAFMTS